MKIINNSDKFPSLSNEELLKELVGLDESLKLATELGTGTGGVETIIDAAEKELATRGLNETQIKNRDLDNTPSDNSVAILSGAPNKVGGSKVFVFGSSDEYVSIGITNRNDEQSPVDVRTGDFLPSPLSDWRVTKIYSNSEQVNEEPVAPGSGSGSKVLEITKVANDTPSDSPVESPKQQALAKARLLLGKRDPQYSGDYKIKEIDDIGYFVWQDVRGGGSIIIGNDGGILFVISAITPETAIQAYKDGKRTPEESFDGIPSPYERSVSLDMLTPNTTVSNTVDNVEIDEPAKSPDTAFAVFEKWLQNHDNGTVNKDDWNINAFEGGFLLSPKEKRSNRVYLVKDKGIVAFSPSSTSFDDAYKQLAG